MILGIFVFTFIMGIAVGMYISSQMEEKINDN